MGNGKGWIDWKNPKRSSHLKVCPERANLGFSFFIMVFIILFQMKHHFGMLFSLHMNYYFLFHSFIKYFDFIIFKWNPFKWNFHQVIKLLCIWNIFFVSNTYFNISLSWYFSMKICLMKFFIRYIVSFYMKYLFLFNLVSIYFICNFLTNETGFHMTFSSGTYFLFLWNNYFIQTDFLNISYKYVFDSQLPQCISVVNNARNGAYGEDRIMAVELKYDEKEMKDCFPMFSAAWLDK